MEISKNQGRKKTVERKEFQVLKVFCKRKHRVLVLIAAEKEGYIDLETDFVVIKTLPDTY